MRIRVAAATVNPTDVQMRSGEHASMMTQLEPPFIAGMEFSGQIDAVGPGISEDMLLRQVMGIVNPRRPQGGAHADWICVAADSVLPIEPHLDFAAVATLPMNGLSALQALELLALPVGGTLLVTGGVGGLGGYVIELARASGLTVVADGNPKDEPLLRELGVNVVVPRGEEMVAAVRRMYPQGVDGLLDAALLGTFAAALVRDGGVAVSARRSHSIDDPRLRCANVMVTQLMNEATMLQRLYAHLVAGQITPRVAARISAANAVEAHKLVEGGGLRGRVVLMFS
ncbi:alcohol dehydrogenase catalytic domain-containing protein [Variovorax sp. E3]|uniref:alcohol dehydrogenase catalytic domain-containing protein n=1 Tax=Variovorax sp. E3 TaxID=1914993 RepID=UPI0027DD06C6|nr:zinc-binding dehydrogenase [Variovorax sp. E3]